MKEIDALNKMKSVLRRYDTNKTNVSGSIFIISTGGTLDKIHNPISEALEFAENSHIEQILFQSKASHFRHNNIMRKDSMDMTHDDRNLIYETILNAPEEKILITHGTSTMVETARFLQSKHDIAHKAIVITGAMRPFSFMLSDAPFNIGCAVGALNILENGVFIAMNGQIFDPNHVEKNVEQGRFETI